MKKCSYCGREGAEEASHCLECGTEFVAESENAQAPQILDRTRIEVACGYAGAMFFIFSLYMLSFGPVTRYTPVVISQSSTTNASGFMTQRTLEYPGWVEIVYYPAISLVLSGGDGGPADFYCQYLRLWEKPETQK